MGLNERSGKTWVMRLETGRIKSPSLRSIALCLRASGARWSEFADLLERVTLPGIDRALFERSGFSEQLQERMRSATEREVARFSLKLAFPTGTRPAAPDRQRRAAERLRNYRVVANLVEQAVVELLKPKPVPTIAYPALRAVARQALGIVWRRLKSKAGREEMLRLAGSQKPGQPLGKGTVPDFRSGNRRDSPQPLVRGLEQKNRFWQTRKLDMELVGEVQALTVRHALQLLKQFPQLFPGFVPGTKEAEAKL
jgi:hypothetical protein